MKKLYTAIIILVVTALIGTAVWYFFFRTVSEVPPGVELSGDVLPFGSGESVNLPLGATLDAPDATYGVVAGKPTTDLFRVYESPIAGFVILPGATTTVRYVDRATGHIYDAELETLEKRKVTNTTLPKIYEAVFKEDGTEVVYRSLGANDTVENTSLALVPPRAGDSSGLYTFTSTALRGEVSELIAGTGDTMYFVLEDSLSISSANFDGTSPRSILRTPFTNWRLNLFNTSLLAWTKASAEVPGYAYTLNTTSGALDKILGPLNGLSVSAAPQNTRIAYSYNESGEMRLTFIETSGGFDGYFLYPATIAEKCVWGRERNWLLYCGVPTVKVGSGEPDNWYKGITHFSDRLWVFDTRVDIADIISEPKKTFGIDIDVYEPAVSANDDYLVFINKSDLSLWALKLEQ